MDSTLNAARRIRDTHEFAIKNAKSDVVAVIQVGDHGSAIWIDSLWVAAEERRQGFATALMREALRWYARMDLYLEALPYTDQPIDAPTLMLWYARFGFKPTDVPGIMYRPADTEAP